MIITHPSGKIGVYAAPTIVMPLYAIYHFVQNGYSLYQTYQHENVPDLLSDSGQNY